MLLSLIFVSCNKENDKDSEEKAKTVKKYNGFIYKNWSSSDPTSGGWVYAQENITIKEFDTYMEVQVGNNSIQSTKIEKEDGRIINVTFSNEWNNGHAQLALDHTNGERIFLFTNIIEQKR